MSNDVIRARNKVARLYIGGRAPDPEAVAEARRGLAVARLERAVREAVDAAPPLTSEQREHIIALLLTGTR